MEFVNTKLYAVTKDDTNKTINISRTYANGENINIGGSNNTKFDKIEANLGTINKILSENVVIGSLKAGEANILKLTSTSINVQNIKSDTADLGTIKGTSADITGNIKGQNINFSDTLTIGNTISYNIKSTGDAHLKSLELDEALVVPELRYKRQDVICGIIWNSFGGGIIANIDSEGAHLKLDSEYGEIGTIAPDDLCMCVWHDIENNSNEDQDDKDGEFKFKGFKTIYFRILTVSGENNNLFTYEIRPDKDGKTYPDFPVNIKNAHFVCYANTDINKKNRHSCKYTTPEYEVRLKDMYDYNYGQKNIISISGDLNNFNFNGEPLEGEGTLFGNAYVYGRIAKLENIPYEIKLSLLPGCSDEIDEGESTAIKIETYKGLSPVITDQNITEQLTCTVNGAPHNIQDKTISLNAVNFNGLSEIKVVVSGIYTENGKIEKDERQFIIKNRAAKRDGKDGVGIDKIEAWYKLSISKEAKPVKPGTSPAADGWKKVPDVPYEQMPYLWQCNKTFYTDNALPPVTSEVYLCANFAPKGDKGDTGKNGQDGITVELNLFTATDFRKNMDDWSWKFGTLVNNGGMFNTNSFKTDWTYQEHYGDVLRRKINGENKHEIILGEWHTLSFWLKGETYKAGLEKIPSRVTTYFYNNGGIVDQNYHCYVDGEDKGTPLSDGSCTFTATDKWVQHSYTFKAKTTADENYFLFRLTDSINKQDKIEISAIKFEKGKHVTTWNLNDKDKIGEEGKPGMNGKNGKTVRNCGEWIASKTYGGDPDFIDIVIYNKKLYQAVGASMGQVPSTQSKWWIAADQFDFVATKLALVDLIHADQIDGKNLSVENGKFNNCSFASTDNDSNLYINKRKDENTNIPISLSMNILAENEVDYKDNVFILSAGCDWDICRKYPRMSMESCAPVVNVGDYGYNNLLSIDANEGIYNKAYRYEYEKNSAGEWQVKKDALGHNIIADEYIASRFTHSEISLTGLYQQRRGGAYVLDNIFKADNYGVTIYDKFYVNKKGDVKMKLHHTDTSAGPEWVELKLGPNNTIVYNTVTEPNI